MSYDFGCPLCLQIYLNISHDERIICVTHVFINNLLSFAVNFIVSCLLSYFDLSSYLYCFDLWIMLWTVELEPIALFKSQKTSASLFCTFELLLLSSPRNACIFVSLDKFALGFPAKISIPDLYLPSNRKLNLQWCAACSLETRVNIWGLQLYINIFCDYCWEVKVSMNRSNSIPLLLAPLYLQILGFEEY